MLELDISRLSQDLIDELFQDVTTIKMCITLRQSQLKHLRMINLVELHTCQAGLFLECYGQMFVTVSDAVFQVERPSLSKPT